MADFSEVFDGPLSEGEHADVSVVLVIPIGEVDESGELGDEVVAVGGRAFFEVVAFVGGVQSEDALLFEDLEVVEDDDHSYFDILFSVVEEEHEVNFDVLDGVAEGGGVLGFAFELFPGFYSPNHSNHVDDGEVVFFQNGVDPFEFAGDGGKEHAGLAHDV